MDSWPAVLAAANGNGIEQAGAVTLGIVLAVVAVGYVALFVCALVSVLRSPMDGGMKLVWVVFALCAPFLGPLCWFLIGRKRLAW